MKKNKMEKKNTPHENSKEKRDNPKRKTPQIYSIKLKIVCFSFKKMNKSKTTHQKSPMFHSFQWLPEMLIFFQKISDLL